MSRTGGWRHLHLGGRARGTGWGAEEVEWYQIHPTLVSKCLTPPPLAPFLTSFMSSPPLSSLHWYHVIDGVVHSCVQSLVCMRTRASLWLFAPLISSSCCVFSTYCRCLGLFAHPLWLSPFLHGDRKQRPTPVEAAEGRTAHNNGWNGLNGMSSNTWKPYSRKCHPYSLAHHF